MFWRLGEEIRKKTETFWSKSRPGSPGRPSCSTHNRELKCCFVFFSSSFFLFFNGYREFTWFVFFFICHWGLCINQTLILSSDVKCSHGLIWWQFQADNKLALILSNLSHWSSWYNIGALCVCVELVFLAHLNQFSPRLSLIFGVRERNSAFVFHNRQIFSYGFLSLEAPVCATVHTSVGRLLKLLFKAYKFI